MVNNCLKRGCRNRTTLILVSVNTQYVPLIADVADLDAFAFASSTLAIELCHEAYAVLRHMRERVCVGDQALLVMLLIGHRRMLRCQCWRVVSFFLTLPYNDPGTIRYENAFYIGPIFDLLSRHGFISQLIARCLWITYTE